MGLQNSLLLSRLKNNSGDADIIIFSSVSIYAAKGEFDRDEARARRGRTGHGHDTRDDGRHGARGKRRGARDGTFERDRL